MPAPEAEVVPVGPVAPVVPVVEALAAATVPLGTVIGGAAEVSPAVEPLPPQPASVVLSSPAVASSASMRCLESGRKAPPSSGTEGFHPPAAVRAVVQVLLAQLIAPVAEAQVLDRPGEL